MMKKGKGGGGRKVSHQIRKADGPAQAQEHGSPLDIFKEWKYDRVHKAVFKNKRIEVGVAATQGPRPRMEDTYAVVPDLDERTSFVAVYDGHGGAAVARFCAKHLHRYLASHPDFQNGDVKKSLKHVFLQMDRLMRSDSGVEELKNLEKIPPVDKPNVALAEVPDGSPGKIDYSGGSSGAGTTAVVLIIQDDKVFVAHTGDSFCTGWNSRKNEAVSLTVDHKANIVESERKRVVEAGGELVRDGKYVQLRDVRVPHQATVCVVGQQVTRTLGDFVFKMNMERTQEEQIVVAVPEILELDLWMLEECEFFVLASDGVLREHVELMCPTVHEWVSQEPVHNNNNNKKPTGSDMQLAFFCESVLNSSKEIDNKTVVIVHRKKQ